MEFIEMTGKALLHVVTSEELHPKQLAKVGVTQESIVRVNRQGDIELRKPHAWEFIGGLLGDFEDRVHRQTGLAWVDPSGEE